MKNIPKWTWALICAAAVAIPAGPAFSGGNRVMHQHDVGRGCAQLVTATHGDLKGKARGAEINKCKNDPEGYK